MDIKKTPPENLSLKQVGSQTEHKIWIGSSLFLALGSFTVYLLLSIHVFDVFGKYLQDLKKLSLGFGCVMLVVTVSKWIEMIAVKRSKKLSNRYNLRRMIRLLSWLAIIGVSISFLFKNWYSAVVSLGLISLILGFALQTPISSFIGWLYIIIRQPYHIGDRIQIDVFKGDVVEINYLDTTLWEFSGDYLTNDLPSGRLIRFPNSQVLQSAVYNYSWEKFPYIWNEIPFHIAYESDIKFVEDKIKEVATKELGNEAKENIEKFKELVAQTPVDELNVKEYPYVSLRINANTWVEITVTYLVEPKQASQIRTNLIKKILAELKQEPDRVMFPKSNSR